MNRLEAFVWILMRDHLPAGAIAEIINKMGEHVLFNPDNPDFRALVENYTKRILIP